MEIVFRMVSKYSQVSLYAWPTVKNFIYDLTVLLARILKKQLADLIASRVYTCELTTEHAKETLLKTRTSGVLTM